MKVTCLNTNSPRVKKLLETIPVGALTSLMESMPSESTNVDILQEYAKKNPLMPMESFSDMLEHLKKTGIITRFKDNWLIKRTEDASNTGIFIGNTEDVAKLSNVQGRNIRKLNTQNQIFKDKYNFDLVDMKPYGKSVKVTFNPMAIQILNNLERNKTPILDKVDLVKGDSAALLDSYFEGEPNNDTTTILQRLAQSDSKLAPLAKNLLKYNINTRIILVDTDSLSQNDIPGLEQIEGGKTVGGYDSKTDTIYIAKNAKFKYTPEATVLHEIIHSLTMHYLKSDNEEAIEMKKLFNHVKQFESQFKDTYPLKNVDEFIVGVFTNHQFIRDLKKIPPMEGSKNYANLWEELFDYFKNLFNMTKQNSSAFEQIFAAGSQIIKANSDYNVPFNGEDRILLDSYTSEQLQAVKNFDTLNSKTTLNEEDHTYSVDGANTKGFKSASTEAKGNIQRKQWRIKTDEQLTLEEFYQRTGTLLHAMQAEVTRKAFPEANRHLTEMEIPAELASVYAAIEKNLESLIAEAKEKGSVLRAETFVANTEMKKYGTIDLLEITHDGKYAIYDLKTRYTSDSAARTRLHKIEEWSTQLSIYNDILTKGDPNFGILPGKVETSKVFETQIKTDKLGNISKISNFNVVAPTFLRTADSKLNELITKLINEIRNLESNKFLTETQRIHNEALLKSKIQLVQDLQLKQNVQTLLDSAFNDLIHIANIIEEKELLKDENETNNLRQTLELYKNLPSFIEKNKLPQKMQDRLSLIEGKASDLFRRLETLSKEVVSSEADRQGVGGIAVNFIDGIFTAVKDIGSFFQWTMGVSNIDNPLVATGYRVLTEAQAKIRSKMQGLAEKLDDAIKEYKKATGNSNYDLMIQQDKNGKYTENLVGEFQHEFWVEKNKATGKNDAEWFNENVNYNPEKYEEAYNKQKNTLDAFEKTKREQIKADLMFNGMNEGPLLEESVEEHYNEFRKTVMDNWIRQNKGDLSAYFTPKTKWKDSKWIDIKEGKYKGSAIEKFYDLHKEYIQMAADISPEHIKENFIANFSSDFIENSTRLGLLGAIKGNWSGLFNNLEVGGDENTYGKVNSFTGETVHTLYIPGISQLRDGNKSMDLGKNLFMFMEGIFRYQEMSAVEETVLSVRELVRNASYIKLDVLGKPILKGGQPMKEEKPHSKTAEVFDAYIDAVLYNKKRDTDSGFLITGNGFTQALGLLGKGDEKKISYAKVVDKLLHYTMLRNLAFNMYAPMVNTLSGTSMMYMTGAGGVDYNAKDLTWAIGMATLGKTNSPTPEALKARLIMEWLGLEANEFVKDKTAKFSSNRLESVINDYNGLSWMRSSENVMHMAGALAMLKSGKHLYNWDDFQVIDGKLTNTKSDDIITRENFRQKVIRVNSRNVGNMNQDDFVLAKRYILGRMLMQHRNWLPSLWTERFGGKRFDYVLERDVEGRYLAAARVVKEIATSGKKFSELTPVEKEAFKNAMTEATIIATIGLLLFALGGMDDDKKKDAWYRYTHKVTRRVLGELYFFADPTFASQYQILTSPAASVSTIQTAGRLIRDTWREGMSDYYDDPKHTKKMAKPMKQLGNMLPPVGQIRRFIDDLYSSDK